MLALFCHTSRQHLLLQRKQNAGPIGLNQNGQRKNHKYTSQAKRHAPASKQHTIQKIRKRSTSHCRSTHSSPAQAKLKLVNSASLTKRRQTNATAHPRSRLRQIIIKTQTNGLSSLSWGHNSHSCARQKCAQCAFLTRKGVGNNSWIS